MATKDKATFEQPGLENRREITNTGGTLDDDSSEDTTRRGVASDEADTPAERGKSGDDAWHARANRSGERGENAVPMSGGNTAK
jgi:hypothetical protein